jgi:hypothetical protein
MEDKGVAGVMGFYFAIFFKCIDEVLKNSS